MGGGGLSGIPGSIKIELCIKKENEKKEKDEVKTKILEVLNFGQFNFLDNNDVEGFINSGLFGVFLSIILNSEELEFKSIEGITSNIKIDFLGVIGEYFSKKVEDIFEENSNEKNFIIKLNKILEKKSKDIKDRCESMEIKPFLLNILDKYGLINEKIDKIAIEKNIKIFDIMYAKIKYYLPNGSFDKSLYESLKIETNELLESKDFNEDSINSYLYLLYETSMGFDKIFVKEKLIFNLEK